MSDDKTVQHRIEELVQQEHELRARLTAGEITEADEHAKLQQLETELDRAWDLLRQRRAKREFGQDPDSAEPRSTDTVEGYLN